MLRQSQELWLATAWSKALPKNPTCFETAVACHGRVKSCGLPRSVSTLSPIWHCLNENKLLKLEHAPAAGACSGSCLSHKHLHHTKNTVSMLWHATAFLSAEACLGMYTCCGMPQLSFQPRLASVCKHAVACHGFIFNVCSSCSKSNPVAATSVDDFGYSHCHSVADHDQGYQQAFTDVPAATCQCIICRQKERTSSFHVRVRGR